MGKLGRILGRPLRIVGLGLGAAGIGEVLLGIPPGASQSVVGVLMDPNQDWNTKGQNALYALKGQVTNPAVFGDLLGAGVVLYISKKLKI